MRRTATVTLAAGVLVTATALTTAAPANASLGFWRTIGLSGADAWGFYNTSNGKVTLNFDLRDLAKDGRSAAVRFTFTKKGHNNQVRLVALKGDSVHDAWQTVTATNDQHMYAQPCLGIWKGTKFLVKTCAPYREYY